MYKMDDTPFGFYLSTRPRTHATHMSYMLIYVTRNKYFF